MSLVARITLVVQAIGAEIKLLKARIFGHVIVASADASQRHKDAAAFVCDGTNDDVEIVAALALGPVQLTAGDFFLRTDEVYLDQNGSMLLGSGFGRGAAGSHGGRDLTHGTRIRPMAGETSGWLISVQQALDDGGTPTASTVAHATVRDLHFESTESGVNGLLVHGHEFQVDNIDVEEMTGGIGIQFQGQDDTHFVTRWSTYNGRANNLHVNNCATGVVMGVESADMHGTNWIINDNTTGIHLTGGSSSQFTNIHTYSNTNNIHFEGGGTRSKWVNIKCEHAQEHAILVTSSGSAKPADVQWSTVGFNCNGESAHNTYDVVHVTSAAGKALRWTWSNVKCGNSDNSTNRARYLFNLTTQGEDWEIGIGNPGEFGTSGDGNLRAGLAGGPSFDEVIHWGNDTIKESLIVTGLRGVWDYRHDTIVQVIGPTPGSLGVVDAGSTVGTARPAQYETVVWLKDNGAGTLTNIEAQDIEIERDA